MWILLEINFVAFVGLLGARENSCQKSSALNYFLIQALGRSLIIISLIFLITRVESLFKPLFFFAILLKLGGAPFHNWYLKLVQKISWPFIWVLSCWQKVVPLLLISSTRSTYLKLASMLSLVVGGARAISQISLKKLFALSSIFTLGWILASILANFHLWVIFLFCYALNLAAILTCSALFFAKSTQLSLTYYRALSTLLFFSFILIMSGIPPFLGFFLKLIVLTQLLRQSITLAIPLALVVVSLFMIIGYLIILFNTLTIFNARNFKSLVKERESAAFYDFFIFNTSIRFIIINFWACNIIT